MLKANNIFPLISFPIGIILGWLGSWFFSTRKKINITQSSQIVLSNENRIEDIEIKFKKTKISHLVQTRITIKNIGNTTIKKEDIANKYFKLVFPKKVNCLQFYTDTKSHDYINPDISFEVSDSPSLNIAFDFLEKNDEFSIIILHDSSQKPEMKGKFISCSISNDDDFSKNIRQNIIFAIVSAIFAVIVLSCIVFLITSFYKTPANEKNPLSATLVIALLSILLVLIILCIKQGISNIKESNKKRKRQAF